MLIDEAQIQVKAGDGGDGLVHFRRLRRLPKGGPDGGDGGDGGNVYFETVSSISKLNQFRYQKKFEAQNGAPGGTNGKTGKGGQDLILQVPSGTTVHYDNGTHVDLDRVGERILIAKGGKGGRGNYSFRSSTNTTPQNFEPGQKKPYRKLHLVLKLIADVGLIGLPNAGKTSLLNELTPTHAKVANYPFTTLEPNLGVTAGNLIVADIPGLIEGASAGKGLGHKFLKHVEKTRLLIHCIPADSSDPVSDYRIIRHEIESYSSSLAQKPEIIVITKSDLIPPKKLKQLQDKLKAVLAVSVLDSNSIKQLNDLISQKLSG